jgi:hypothetical protein
MADLQSKMPDRRELMHLTPYEGSKRIVQVFHEAKAELERRGVARPSWEQVGELLGSNPSTYNTSRNHIVAVEIHGISPNLPKMEALRRLRTLDPWLQRVADDAIHKVEPQRGDPEMLANAISKLLAKIGTEMPKYDAKALAAFLRNDPQRRGATHSAVVELRAWLATLEKALDSPLQR